MDEDEEESGDSLEEKVQFPLCYTLGTEQEKAYSELCEFLDRQEIDKMDNYITTTAISECLLKGINYFEQWEELEKHAAQFANWYIPWVLRTIKDKLHTNPEIQRFTIPDYDDREIYARSKQRLFKEKDKGLREKISKLLKPAREDDELTFFIAPEGWTNDFLVREIYLKVYGGDIYKIVREENLSKNEYSLCAIKIPAVGGDPEILITRKTYSTIDELERQLRFVMNYWDQQHKASSQEDKEVEK